MCVSFKNKTKASVLIFTYNRKQFIKNALDSVIASQQMVENVEIIISTCINRNELELDPVPSNVKYVTFPPQTSYGDQLIRTVNISKGEILLFLEDDDVFNPHKIKVILEQFENNSDVIAVKNATTKIISEGYIDESVFMEGDEISNFLSKSRDYHTDLITPRDIYDMISGELVYNPSTISVRRAVILENEDMLRNNHPFDILLSAAILNIPGVIKYLDKSLTAYRLHSSNDSYFGQERDLHKLQERMLITSNKYVEGLRGASNATNLRPTAKLLIQHIISREEFTLLILKHYGARDILIKAVMHNLAREFYLGKQVIKNRGIINSGFLIDFIMPFIKIVGLNTLTKKFPFALIYILNKNLSHKIYIKYLLSVLANSR